VPFCSAEPALSVACVRQDECVAGEPNELPQDIDERLWIHVAGCDGCDYLWGNAHTYPGRMEAYCPHKRRDFAVSKYQVTDASPEARMWIEGFLRGNEPPPPQAEDMRPAWRSLIKVFHRSGRWEQPD
jgi:hypothetical protein